MSVVIGQEKSTRIGYIGLAANYGQIYIHSSHVENLNGVWPYGFEIDMGNHYFSDHIRDVCGSFPRMGNMFQYWNFNSDILGWGTSTIFYMEPFLMTTNKFMMSIRGGAGLIYLSKPYDELSNPENAAYSKKYGFPLYLGFSAYVPLTLKSRIRLTGSFQHISNGGVSKPNYGLNYGVFTAAMEFSFKEYKIPPRKFGPGIEMAPRDREKRTELSFFMAFKGDEDTGEASSIIGIHGRRALQLTRINGLTYGGLLEVDQTQSGSILDKSRLSIFAGHEFWMGGFNFSQELGVYVYKPQDSPSYFMQFYTLQYRIANRVLLGVSGKAHFITADYLGFKIGIQLAKQNTSEQR